MAWGALATGARAATGSTGQGLSLMQESFSEITLAELPLVDLQHGARPAGLLPGDARRRSRRLPPHRARAPGRARRRRARAARVPPRRQVAQPRARLRRLPARPHAGSAHDRAEVVPRRSRRRTGPSTASRRARVESASVTPLGVGKVGQRAFGQEGKAQYIATKTAAHGARGARRDRLPRRRGDGDRRVRLARQVREVRDQAAARRRPHASATSVRSRCGRSPTTRSRDARRRRRAAGRLASSSRRARWSTTCASASPAGRR